MSPQTALPLLIAFAGCAAATVTDIRRYKIYNGLTLPLLAGGLIYHLAVAGMAGLGASAAGMLLGFMAMFVLYLVGVMGGGDVKLVAAIGAWLGGPVTLLVAAVGCAAAGLFSLAILAKQGRLRESWTGLQVALFRIHALTSRLGCEDEREQLRAEVRQAKTARRPMVPFSIMLAIGVVAIAVFDLWSVR